MNIKIFACYHRESPLVRSDVIIPIHCGKAGASVRLGIDGDDTGDNISFKNTYFCELTATYWIWKNATADAVGLFHYRRFFNFRTLDTKFKEITPAFPNDYGMTAKVISGILKEYDAILPHLTRSKKETLYERYEKSHVISDMDAVFEIIGEKYPGMLGNALGTIKHGRRMHGANMVIAPKPLFDEYACWMFDILFELERKIQGDVAARDARQRRAYGFLGEWMTTMFFEHKKQTDGLKAKELPVLFLEDTAGKWRRYAIRRFFEKNMMAIGLGREKWGNGFR
jgi:hypothetical protein